MNIIYIYIYIPVREQGPESLAALFSDLSNLNLGSKCGLSSDWNR